MNNENITITKLPNSEVEITGEIPTEEVARFRVRALRKLNETATIPGFRKGRVPEDVLVRHVGEARLMEETAELALSHTYPRIVEEHKLAVLGQPEITITKLAAGNPLGFKIKTAVFPAVTLPDYKTAAKDLLRSRPKKILEVTEAEVESMLRAFRPKTEHGATEPPPLTDEEIKKLGDFKDVADLKTRLKEDMLKQKERREREEVRAAIAEKIIGETSIPLPPVLIENEILKMFGQFRQDIERMGMKFEVYLSKIKKSEDDLRKEWRPDAEKRAKLELILPAIAEAEKITPADVDIERETKHLLEHQKDADPERVRLYIENLLTKEKVFQFLESQN